MAGIITNHFRIKNARNFIESAGPIAGGADDRDSYYAFIGQPIEWTGGPSSVPTKDNTEDNRYTESLIWEQMMSLKRIMPTSMMHGVKKIAWESGRFYDIYRHDYDGIISGVAFNGTTTNPPSLANANYYVVFDSFAYICINNNNNSASTIRPDTLTYGPSNFYTARAEDGYVWRQVAYASALDSTHFETADFLPVRSVVIAPEEGDVYHEQYEMQVVSKSRGGGVYHIVVTNGGTGYGANLSGTVDSGAGIVTLQGNGNGAWVGYVKTNANGTITDIIVAEPGAGYDYATVVFSGGSGTATGTAVITPSDGLGTDPIRDLSAHNVIVNMKFSSADTELTTSNDYRRIGIVVNPYAYGTDTILRATTATNMTSLVVGSVTGLDADQVIKQTNVGAIAYGAIVDVENALANNKTIRVIRTRSDFSPIENTGSQAFEAGKEITNGTVTTTITSVVPPTVEQGSGNIIYYENRRAITRSPAQEEEIKIVFEF